jgi:hypothetical protein
VQHTVVLWREYADAADRRPAGVSRGEWMRMLVRYQLSYAARHFRKTDTSHALGRGINNIVWTRKQARHHYHHAVYNMLVGARVARGKARRAGRRVIYELLMLTHRLKLRGRGETPSR